LLITAIPSAVGRSSTANVAVAGDLKSSDKPGSEFESFLKVWHLHVDTIIFFILDHTVPYVFLNVRITTHRNKAYHNLHSTKSRNSFVADWFAKGFIQLIILKL